jgi:hypothetical protein
MGAGRLAEPPALFLSVERIAVSVGQIVGAIDTAGGRFQG